MNKLWIIIKREYLSRVTKRSFILTTILTPIAIGVFMVVVALILSYKGDDQKQIRIYDPANILEQRIKDQDNFYFNIVQGNSLDEILQREDIISDGLLYIPPISNIRTKDHTIYYYSDNSLDLDAIIQLERIIQEKVRDYKISSLQIDKNQLLALDTKITLDPEPLTKGESDSGNPSPLTSVIGAGIGGIMGFFMYMIVFINGMMVMRSVMEEKTNRIVEIMISNVKPFQLMLGKITGVGAVGLTQIAIWMLMIPLIFLGVQLVFDINPDQMAIQNINQSNIPQDDIEVLVYQATQELGNIQWWWILPCFLIFFIGGYFIYSSLFAAVGSAMGDDLGEGQALTLPITLPIILALYIMFVAIRVPNSSLAVFASIFPLFSPIVMPARLAFNPPVWQILLSILLLAIAVLCSIWISARIYRIGILLYGKKATFKEIVRWTFQKN